MLKTERQNKGNSSCFMKKINVDTHILLQEGTSLILFSETDISKCF